MKIESLSHLIVFVATFILLCFSKEVSSESIASKNVYFFGVSEMHPVSEEEQIIVWLDRLAQAGGHVISFEGEAGDLRRFAFELPPKGGWKTGAVKSVFDQRSKSFQLSGFSSVLVAVAPEDMERSPIDPFSGSNKFEHTPVSVSILLLDWLERIGGGPRILVLQERYEGQSIEQVRIWHASYLEKLRGARPQQSVQGVPLYLGISRMSDLVGTDAASDPSSIAFMKALIIYGVLFSETPPLNFVLPESLPERVRSSYPELVRLTLPIIANYPDDLDLPPLLPLEGIENPALGIGLSRITDWSPQQPFLNIIKSSRVWRMKDTKSNSVVELSNIEDMVYFDSNGWAKQMPEGAEFLSLLILTDQPVESVSVKGRYVLRYKGRGRIEIAGRAYDVDYKLGEIRFSFSPGPGFVEIRILATDPMRVGDYIRDIEVFREDQLELVAVGLTFNPDWLRHIRDMRLVRFQDWMLTNTLTVESISQAPKLNDFTYSWRGVPIEISVQLANEIGADAWFNIPHAADNAYIHYLAEAVYEKLNPNLKVYIEYSNELWNFVFPQASWVRERAIERWGAEKGSGDAWMQYAGMRAAEAVSIWAKVFGENNKDRLVRVVSVHTGWLGLEEPLLLAPLWVSENPTENVEPYLFFDAYGVAGYMAQEGEQDDKFRRVRDWLREGQEFATKRLADEIRSVALYGLKSEIFPYHARVARKYGLDLVMYEGGTHVVAEGEWVNDDVLSDFFNYFNYTSEVARLYTELLEVWQSNDGQFFNAFVDVYAPDRWGSWGNLRHLDDINPRWLALTRHNATARVGWEERVEGTFSHGIVRRADAVGGEVRAVHTRDVLLGGPGDDLMVAVGCCTRMHGGGGWNRAFLPGKKSDYLFQWSNQALKAANESGEIWMVNIQEMRFQDEPADSLAIVTGVLP